MGTQKHVVCFLFISFDCNMNLLSIITFEYFLGYHFMVVIILPLIFVICIETTHPKKNARMLMDVGGSLFTIVSFFLWVAHYLIVVPDKLFYLGALIPFLLSY